MKPESIKQAVAIGTGFVFWTGICLLLSGCVSGISKQARSRITYSGSFTELQTQVEAYSGAVVLLGGKILAQVFQRRTASWLPGEQEFNAVS